MANTIRWWVYGTMPTLDRFMPIGDQPRVSVPWIYDYLRSLVETASFGYVRLRLEQYADDDLRRWAERLSRTAWQQIHVYFMHEPTAPAYAKALMAFAR